MTSLWLGRFTDDAGTEGIVRFAVDGTSLDRQDSVDLASPAWLVEAGGKVWAIQHLPASAVVALDADAQPVDSAIPTDGDAACHGSLNPSGTALAVAHYTSGSLAVLPLEGGAPELLTFSGASMADPDRQEAPHAHHTAWLDDHHLLVCDLGADLVRLVRWDGTLTEVGAIETEAGFGPRHLVLRERDGITGFVVCGELSGELAFFRHEAGDWATGWHHMSTILGTLVGGSQPSALRQLDADTLVLANRGINTLALVDWDDDSLALLDEFDCGGDHPRDLVVHEGNLWVANKESGDVCCLNRVGELLSRTTIEQPGALLFRG